MVLHMNLLPISPKLPHFILKLICSLEFLSESLAQLISNCFSFPTISYSASKYSHPDIHNLKFTTCPLKRWKLKYLCICVWGFPLFHLELLPSIWNRLRSAKCRVVRVVPIGGSADSNTRDGLHFSFFQNLVKTLKSRFLQEHNTVITEQRN